MPGGGDRLGDLAAHGAGADDGGLEDEHGSGLSSLEAESEALGVVAPRSSRAKRAQRALERVAHRAADEQEIDTRRTPRACLIA